VVLRTWLTERARQPGGDVLFPTHRGCPLSRDAVERLVAKHAAACPSLTGRKVTPHTLRHTTAMALLHGGVDTSVIALWLGSDEDDRAADEHPEQGSVGGQRAGAGLDAFLCGKRAALFTSRSTTR
jgi:integrase